MKKVIRLSESKLFGLISHLVEQVEGDYYKISPEDYLELLKLSGDHARGISKLPKFQGKPLWITGSLKVNNKDINDLGNIGYVEGSLDISYTKISDISQIKVKGNVWDSGTPREAKRLAAELREKRNEADQRRQDNEWDPENTDDVGLRANALFEWLVGENELETMDDETKERLNNLKSELEELKKRYDSDETDSSEISDLYDKITDIETEIEEIQDNSTDVYDLVQMKYNHYGLTMFEVLSKPNREYAVGTDDEMEEAALEYAKNYIDEMGTEGFSRHFIEDYLDEDRIRDFIEDFYENDIRDSPDSYFSEDDFQLTDEQEERKEQLEEYIEEMEDLKSETEEEQRNLEDSDSDEYYDLDEKIQEIDSNIEKAQAELDLIVVDDEPTEEMIQDKLNEMVDDRMSDPIDFFREFGYDFKNYVDEDKLAQGLVDSDGWGIMNSYDSSYDSINFQEQTYYIMRIN